jgi:hypothetical protein
MAIQQAWREDLDLVLNRLVRLRDRTDVYYEDWATLPPSIKAALKSRFNTAIQQAKADLDAVNTMVQGL